jgi:hypothetical protein
MPRDATEGVSGEEGLSPSQLKALSALIAGTTITDAADIAGVDRTTVHRWIREPEFCAAHNARRAELRDAVEAKLRALQAKAIEVVESALDGGDVRTAMGILRGTGALDGCGPRVGSDDPETVASQQKRARRNNDLLIALS